MNTKRTPSLRLLAASILLAALVSSVCWADVVAYWRFEEGAANVAASGANSALDSSGNGLNGTPINGPVYRSNVPPFGNVHPNVLSMEFNGSNQRVFVPDDPRFRLTQSLTIEAFVFARPLLGGEIGSDILFRGDDRIGLDPYRLTLQFTGDLLFQVMDASGQYASVTANIPFNQWLHVAGVLDDSNGSMKLYVDGNLAGSTTTSVRPFALLDPSQNPGIGIGGLQSSNPSLGPEYFNGFIDELRLSNAALSPDQLLVPEPSSMVLGLLASAAFFLRRVRRNP